MKKGTIVFFVMSFLILLFGSKEAFAGKGGRIGLEYLFPRTYEIKNTGLKVDATNMGMLLFSVLKTKEKTATRVTLGIGITKSEVKNCTSCSDVSSLQISAGFSYLFRFSAQEDNPSGFYLGPTLSVASFKAGNDESAGGLFLGATAIYALKHGQTFFLTFHALPFAEKVIKQDPFLSAGITF